MDIKNNDHVIAADKRQQQKSTISGRLMRLAKYCINWFIDVLLRKIDIGLIVG